MRYTERFDVITAVDKNGNQIHHIGIEIEDKTNGYEKLAQLEDIEESLGIDLTILFKALKNGVYFTSIKEIWNVEFCESPKLKYFDIRDEYHLVDYDGTYAKITDYGKTWALTKEE